MFSPRLGANTKLSCDSSTEQLGVLWVLKPLPVISNTVPSPFAPPAIRRAEQVAVGVGDQAAVGCGTVGAVEADQGGGGAGVAVGGLGDLEHRAVAVRPRQVLSCRTGRRGRRRSGCRRIGTVGAVEADQGGGGAGVAVGGLGDLEHRAVVVRPA